MYLLYYIKSGKIYSHIRIKLRNTTEIYTSKDLKRYLLDTKVIRSIFKLKPNLF